MKLSLKESGLKELLEDLQNHVKQGKTVIRQALSDTGKKVIKYLKAERSAGGFVPLGKVDFDSVTACRVSNQEETIVSGVNEWRADSYKTLVLEEVGLTHGVGG